LEDKLIQELFNELDNIFINLQRDLKNKSVGVLFSGGVDSSTIALFAKKHDIRPTLYNFGTDKSKDKDFAFSLAKDLDLPLAYNEITSQEINITIPLIKKELNKIGIDDNPMQVSLALGVYFIGKFAAKDGVKVMLTGQGSDELFAGYKKYETISPSKLQERLSDDIKSVASVDVKRDGHMLGLSGISIIAPFIFDDFVSFGLSIPVSYKINNKCNKYILRKMAFFAGLPEYIALRPKHAMQYSSGIQKVVDKINKDNRKLS
jgi:asparagine synthase (glutamine-hydrolysing)